MLNLKEDITLFPFDYGPENKDSRQICEITENTFTADFNFTTQNTPEYAGIAMFFEKNVPSSVQLSISRIFGDITSLAIQVKRGKHSIHHAEISVDTNKTETTVCLGLPDDVSQIMFVLYSSKNHNKYGRIKISCT